MLTRPPTWFFGTLRFEKHFPNSGVLFCLCSQSWTTGTYVPAHGGKEKKKATLEQGTYLLDWRWKLLSLLTPISVPAWVFPTLWDSTSWIRWPCGDPLLGMPTACSPFCLSDYRPCLVPIHVQQFCRLDSPWSGLCLALSYQMFLLGKESQCSLRMLLTTPETSMNAICPLA